MPLRSGPPPGVAQEIEPGVRRVLAPNPSAMTHWGTNSYLVGTGEVALIDPGPDDPHHLAALLAALQPTERISHIFVTHAHRDHSGLAPALARETGAPVLAFGDATAGRRDDLAALGRLGGGEGVDAQFAPDQTLTDGQTVEGATWSLTALHTPGHMGNHICLAFGDVLFSGDHVMGWSTSIVSPPDGDLRAFVTSVKRLQSRSDRRYLPGHGAPLDRPADRLAELVAHRQNREDQIIAALADAPASAPQLAQRIYTNVRPALLPAAARNVFAHLIDLMDRNMADCLGPLSPETPFALKSTPVEISS